MARPTTLVPRPSLLIATLGGAVATLLLNALLFLAPVFGFPFVDVPRLVGGVFTGNVTAALWLGFWIFFGIGWLVFPFLFTVLWPRLPGRSEVTLASGLGKGLAFGGVLWVLGGLSLPVLGWLGRIEGVENPGLFALGEGVLAALGVLLGHLAYGAALGLVAAMGREISPVELLGWNDTGWAVRGRSATSGNR